jgi:hypothetical protein
MLVVRLLREFKQDTSLAVYVLSLFKSEPNKTNVNTNHTLMTKIGFGFWGRETLNFEPGHFTHCL